MNKKFGIVGNEFITDCEVDNIIVDVYAILRTLNYHIEDRTCDMNIFTLYKILSVPDKKKTARDEVKYALQWLIDNKRIKVTDLLDNEFRTIYDIDIHEILRITFPFEDEGKIESGGFTKIPSENIKAILNYIKIDKTIKKYSLMRYYLIIARACSNSASFGSISVKKIKDKMSDIGEKTCCRYNEILQDLGVIFYNNNYGYIDKNGNFKLTGTMFGHRNVINESAAGELTQQGFNSLVESHTCGKYIEVNKQQIASKKSDSMKKTLAEKKAEQIRKEELFEKKDEILNKYFGEDDECQEPEPAEINEKGEYVHCSHDELCRINQQQSDDYNKLTPSQKKLVSVGIAKVEDYFKPKTEEEQYTTEIYSDVGDFWGEPSCF